MMRRLWVTRGPEDTWYDILTEGRGLSGLACHLIDHFVCEALSRVFTRCSRSCVLIWYDEWWLEVVKNVPIGRSGLCWIDQQLLLHPIHLKAGNKQLSNNSSQAKRPWPWEWANQLIMSSSPESIVCPCKHIVESFMQINISVIQNARLHFHLESLRRYYIA